MKRRFFLIPAAAFLFWGAALHAADFELVYKTGLVEIQKGEGWAELADGDKVSGEAAVRLASGAIAEFSAAGGTIVFSKAGSYLLDAAAAADRGAQPNAAASIVSRLKKIGGKVDRGQGGVMGVRAERFDADPILEWDKNDASRMEEAAAAYARGDYPAAISILEKEVDPTGLEDKSEYLFILAASYFGGGKKGPALRIAAAFEPEESSLYHADFLFLKGLLLNESRDFSGAAASFARYIKASDGDEDLQMGYFLLGRTLLRMGDDARARTALQEAVRIPADAEVARLAGELLK